MEGLGPCQKAWLVWSIDVVFGRRDCLERSQDERTIAFDNPEYFPPSCVAHVIGSPHERFKFWIVAAIARAEPARTVKGPCQCLLPPPTALREKRIGGETGAEIRSEGATLAAGLQNYTHVRAGIS